MMEKIPALSAGSCASNFDLLPLPLVAAYKKKNKLVVSEL